MSSLQELRQKLGFQEKVRETVPWSLLPEGLPRGGLVEISGAGKTEAVASLLAEHSCSALWIEKALSVNPSALLQRRVRLEKLFFVEAGKEAAWAATAALRSQLFPLLVFDAPYGDERELRRFQLLAEKARSTMILLCDRPSLLWPIRLSLEMRGGKPTVLRRK